MAKVNVQNTSGIDIPATNNPYDGLLEVCQHDPKQIQGLYQKHRVNRNEQQKQKILSSDFEGWILDEHLLKLDGPQKDPDYVDPRNCLTSWARPPKKVVNLIKLVQSKLKDAAPELWLMPLNNLHVSAMEVTHSRSEEEIEELWKTFEPICQTYADFTLTHRARLIKPMISYDSAALALTFVPAAGECLSKDRKAADDTYTYHNLRRDLHNYLVEAGVPVASRYVVPSAHLTIARFNSPNVFEGDPLDTEVAKDLKKRQRWVKEIEMINNWLEAEYWPREGEDHIKAGGEWIVGEEKGLEIKTGQVWYGDGNSKHVGKGF